MSERVFCKCWAVLWRSNNDLDGLVEHLVHRGRYPVTFRTRREARAWIVVNYDWLKRKPELRNEPHGWRMPSPIKVKVVEAR